MSPAEFWCRMPIRRVLQEADLKVVTKRQPTPEEKRALLFAWKVSKHVKSNAILYARDGQTVGVGAGQMSRVDACKIGAMKAVLPLQGTVAASDAFFPFPDGVEEIAKVGATAIIQPGGSVRDQEVIEAADRLGLAMIFTGVRHFRHWNISRCHPERRRRIRLRMRCWSRRTPTSLRYCSCDGAWGDISSGDLRHMAVEAHRGPSTPQVPSLREAPTPLRCNENKKRRASKGRVRARSTSPEGGTR